MPHRALNIRTGRRGSIIAAGFLGALILSFAASDGMEAQDCDLSDPRPSICGQISGFVPFHKDAIHASLIWSGKKARCPKLLTWMRPAEYTPYEYLNPTDPQQDPQAFPGFDATYMWLVQGGFPLGQLDESGWSRFARDRERENAQLVDVCGLQALIDEGGFTITSFADPDLNDGYMALTEPFFEDAGYSKGLAYNLFCAGNVAGADGRIYVTGGHDKGGNNGIRKINVFDPETETWLPRGMPCVRSEWEADPGGGVRQCADSPDGTMRTDALNEFNTDPPVASDMEYQRWYPTSVTLPDGRILILSGSDQDTAAGPADARATKVRQKVPEVYDPRSETSVSLKNSQKLLSMYPRAFVVQTGPGRDDWKVCVAGGVVVPPLPGPPAPAPLEPGQCRITTYDPWHYSGDIECLDVVAALADPDRGVDGEHHWEHVGSLASAHDSGAAVRAVTIRSDRTWDDKVYLFGGTDGCDADAVATAEMIDFSASPVRSRTIAPLLTAVDENNAVVLPDGRILVVGGHGGEENNLRYQMYAPDGSRTLLLESPVPRYDHSTMLVVPGGSVWVMGGNRVNLTALAEPQPQALRDLAVPVLEEYRPPYFFKGVGRPVLEKSPDQIHYGQTFVLRVANAKIGAVTLLRTGPVTHNWSWGNQYVSLPFTEVPSGRLKVAAPPLPGLAVPGHYLMFVVSTDGVPSEGRHVFVHPTPR